MFTDKTLTCRDCGESFIFTSSEQQFFSEKGFTNEPSRCPACRALRRNGDNRNGDSRNGRERFGEGARQMYSAVCASCGQNTQVPFKPRDDRPVYCRECFEKKNSRY